MMNDFYIPKTKQGLVSALVELGDKKPSVLWKMGKRQLYAIYFTTRRKVCGKLLEKKEIGR